MSTLLSININKVALLRNSRESNYPNLRNIAELIIKAGAQGITVHPRQDARHITLDDVIEISQIPEIKNRKIEYNIEGDLRPDLIRLIKEVNPTQFTVVPVIPGEKTSGRGWRAYDDHELLKSTIKELSPNIRISVFCDPDKRSVHFAHLLGANAVEIYTGEYAKAFYTPEQEIEFNKVVEAAAYARQKGLRVNAGHDINLENISLLTSAIKPDEYSIGHSPISESIIYGMENVVKMFLEKISAALVQ